MRLKEYSPKMVAKKVLLGTVLGDGCLVASQYGTGNTYLVMNHGIDQIPYVLWKMQMLEPVTGPFSVRMFKRTGKGEWSTRPKINVWSLSNKYLGNIHDDFYMFDAEDTGRFKKVVRLNVLRRLTPESLAVWFMDDGCLSVTKSTLYIRLATNGFTMEENELVCKYMAEMWGIHFVTDQHVSGSWSLRANTESSQKFCELIEPYMCPSMLYKIDSSCSAEHLDENQGDDMIRAVLKDTELVRKYQPLVEQPVVT